VLVLALGALVAAAPSDAAAKPGRPGIDVSRFNGIIDWTQVAGSGIEFAFVAASRGNGLDCAVASESCGADPYYAANYANARLTGVRVGPYHRAFIGGGNREALLADARAEADVFTTSVGSLRRKDLRPALDVETPFSVAGPHAVRIWIRAWLKRVRKRLHAKPIIYTNTTSWSATGDTREFGRKGHPLWIANWNVSSPSIPAGNWARKKWSIWQYSSSGKVPGIAGRVDLDRLRVRFGKVTVG
jgi:GH25 family lysozyme M1 (1,4-beta-N-acetylmuramidase)